MTVTHNGRAIALIRSINSSSSVFVSAVVGDVASEELVIEID